MGEVFERVVTINTRPWALHSFVLMSNFSKQASPTHTPNQILDPWWNF